MIDIPTMPDDWWPDMTVVRGQVKTDDGRELHLSFAFSAEAANNHACWDVHLKEMRFALWREMHTAKETV